MLDMYRASGRCIPRTTIIPRGISWYYRGTTMYNSVVPPLQKTIRVNLATPELDNHPAHSKDGAPTYELWLEYRDILECVAMIFGNPNFRGQMKFRHEGSATYGCPWNGTAWKAAEEAIGDPTVVPVPVWQFLDGTHVTTKGRKVLPGYTSIGNTDEECANKDGSRVLQLFAPDLAAAGGFTEQERKSVWFRRRKRILMQQVYAITLKPLITGKGPDGGVLRIPDPFGRVRKTRPYLDMMPADLGGECRTLPQYLPCFTTWLPCGMSW